MAALPAGWQERFSDQHQRAYYANSADGQTSWTRPAGGARGAPATPQRSTAASSAARPAQATGGLPAGWAESFSQQHQRAFYRNSATGETSWTRPAASAGTETKRSEETANPLHAGEETANPLHAGGWVESFSQQHQRPFYRNSATGETSWTKPSAQPAARAGMAKAGISRATSRARLPTAARARGASQDATVHVFGGGDTASAFLCQGKLNSAEMFGMGTGWSDAAPPGVRGGCAAVALGKDALLFGGGSSATDVKLYSQATDAWRNAGKYKSTRIWNCLQGVHCPAAVELDGLVYLVGGADTSGALASMQLYIPTSSAPVRLQRIMHLSNMRVARAGCSCATLGDLIYVVGGRSGVFPCTSVWYSSVETYDPEQDIWGKISNMSEPREGCATVAIAGRLYVIGGSDKNRPLSSVEYFDPKQGKWFEVSPMSTPRHGVAAVALPNNKILATGGWDGKQALRSCEVYDMATDQWSQQADMAIARMYHAICCA